MNITDSSNMKKLLLALIWIGFAGLQISCTKDKQQIKQYVLGEVPAPGYFPSKSNPKTDLQFISIAFSDLFGEQISGIRLNRLMDGYNALGDKQIIIDRILKNLLKDPAVIKPSDAEMRSNTTLFVRDTYRKFLVREPNDSELWYLKKLLAENPDITTDDVYYAFMTSEEYKYY
jgi:hypothetical protein